MPELAPPYDDAPAAALRSGRPRRLALVGSDPEPDPARPGQPGRPAPGRRRPGTEPIPGVGAWPTQFAQVLAETLAGARSAEQLAPWTTLQARRRISRLGPMLGYGPQPRIRRIILTSPVPDVLEMTAIIAVGSQVHAVAVRLERPAAAGAGPLPSQDSDDPSSPDGPACPPGRGTRTRRLVPDGPVRPPGRGTRTRPRVPDGPACPPGSSARTRPAIPDGPAPAAALTAAPSSRRAARLRATARWLCTAVEVA